jgi:5-methylcytosine-specific restriction endonuclease McrBC GTP-binding regulatory subunit McrB
VDNVTFVKVKDGHTDELIEHAIIDQGNGEFTSMPKSTYDAMQAANVANLRLAEVPATIEAPQPDEADLTEGTN